MRRAITIGLLKLAKLTTKWGLTADYIDAALELESKMREVKI
jgi:hypothetical protein